MKRKSYVLFGSVIKDCPDKFPYLGVCQNEYRVYLDEYPEQKELRKEFFAKRWNLSNDFLRKVA